MKNSFSSISKRAIAASAAAAALCAAAAFIVWILKPASAIAAGPEMKLTAEAPSIIDAAATLPAAPSAAGRLAVSGSGAVSVEPDIAYVTVGVSTQHAVPGKAQELNSAAAEKVIAAVKALGIEAKDLVTADYTIYPQYDYQNGNAITGYNVSYTVRVTVRDLTKAGPVLDAAVQAGANFGAGIQFALEDQKAAYEKALDLAIKNAVQKAAAAAKSLGATIGAPVELTESGAGYSAAPVPMALESSARDAVQIETGRLSISASVTAVFNY